MMTVRVKTATKTQYQTPQPHAWASFDVAWGLLLAAAIAARGWAYSVFTPVGAVNAIWGDGQGASNSDFLKAFIPVWFVCFAWSVWRIFIESRDEFWARFIESRDRNISSLIRDRVDPDEAREIKKAIDEQLPKPPKLG